MCLGDGAHAIAHNVMVRSTNSYSSHATVLIRRLLYRTIMSLAKFGLKDIPDQVMGNLFWMERRALTFQLLLSVTQQLFK